MPKPFHQLTLNEFATLLRQFPFRQRINAVHMHHTWRPRHSDYKGLATIDGMWKSHTETNKWSDIAQHVTIAPDGTIWTGRNWNQPPPSAAGHNGNKDAGPLIFQLIGDFDQGRDRFEGAQRETALQVITLVQQRFELALESLLFHSQMSAKSCPGRALNYEEILDEVRRLHAAPPSADAAGGARGEEGPFDESLTIQEVLHSFSRNVAPGDDPPDAELPEADVSGVEEYSFAAGGVRGIDDRGGPGRAAKLTPEMLDDLRPHVINLSQGLLSSDDDAFKTEPGDVDAIFDQHLVRAWEHARNKNKQLRLLFWAHGGLVSESSGLQLAHRHVRWWRDNDVYPIYFVWETGLLETLGQLLAQARQHLLPAGRRDIWDYTTDPISRQPPGLCRAGASGRA